ncbi:SNARE-associated protein-related [Striga hermonthica]|uniref:Biogenesis of lysosome-related organelles complex 1 subunit 7 n=1 Tax=Striga hermonthica TaxID=68872 RepID=A0A9N7R3B6_STRHE|nr:SNARE-associated protein-related [Striga hermonthica]
MADENPADNQQSTATIGFSGAESNGGTNRTLTATHLTAPITADGNPNYHRQDSTAQDFSESGTDSGDKADSVGDIITSSCSDSPVAEGLYSLISSVLTSFDSRADATSRSQEQLAFSLDRLTGELDKLLEDAPSPFIMQHAGRISGLRKRVKALNTVLKNVQRQIDNMDRMMSTGLVHEKLAGESSGQQPDS